MNKKMKLVLLIALFSASALSLAKDIDVVRTGAPVPNSPRASEVTNISFNGTVPAAFVGALDADDSTFNRVFGCGALSGVGTAVAYDLVNIANTTASAGSIVVTSRLSTGVACATGAGNSVDTHFSLLQYI